MSNKSELLLSLLDGQPVIPVLKIERANDAVPLARALAKGGLRMIEITLRTSEAVEAIRRAASEVEEAIVGAGTILSAAQFEEAAKAGSRFIVSPALAARRNHAKRDHDSPGGRSRLPEVFPRGTGWRRCVPQVACISLRRNPVLPDRRYRNRKREGLSRPA